MVLSNSPSSGPQKTLMLQGAVASPGSPHGTRSGAASIFSRGRGGGWVGCLLPFLFLF